jgi:hypothetical protein
MQKPSENDRVRYAMLPRLLDPTLALLREEEEEASYTPPRARFTGQGLAKVRPKSMSISIMNRVFCSDVAGWTMDMTSLTFQNFKLGRHYRTDRVWLMLHGPERS